jgi:hypothetical protein
VRVLQNVNRNMVVMNYVGEVPAAMLPPRIVSLAPSGGSLEGPTPHMTSTLQSADAQGTIPPPICRMAAAYLEVSPATLYRKSAKWDETDPPTELN